MKTRMIPLTIVILLLAAALTSPAYGGGWAAITLDRLPTDVVAGQAVEIGFVVRQHGVSPMSQLAPKIIAVHAETLEMIEVSASASGETGHYSAQITFPSAGEWDWSILAFSMDQPMPALEVAAATPGQAAALMPGLPMIPVWWAAGLGVMVVFLASVLAVRKKIRWAAAVVIAALVFTGGGMALAARLSPEPAPEEVVVPKAATVSDLSAYGEDLFLAKGCITCHTHSAVTMKYEVFSGISGPVGSAPNLTDYKGSPEFLRLWLADPQGTRPDASMLDLDLAEDEIEALIAFLME